MDFIQILIHARMELSRQIASNTLIDVVVIDNLVAFHNACRKVRSTAVGIL